MGLPIFGYNNLMTTGTVTSTSEDTDFPVTNLENWKPARWWKAAATGTQYVNVDAGALVDVDYFAVFSHDLTEKSATVKLQYGIENLVLYSEEFDNAAWTKSSGTIVSTTQTAPDSTNTAEEFLPDNAASGYIPFSYNFVAGEKTTASIYVKQGAGSPAETVLLLPSALWGGVGGNRTVTLTFATGEIEVGGATASGTVEDAGNSWYRISLTAIPDTTVANAIQFARTAGNGTDSVYIWGGQFEEGDLGEYVKTTTVPVLGGWEDLTSALQKSNSQVIFDTFTSVNKRYFRVEVIAATAICSIGVISIGERLDMPMGISKGFTPAHLDTKNKNLINIADEGLPIGNSNIRREASINATIDMVTEAWVRANWEPLLAHAELNPLFFSWNYEDYPDESVFVMLDVTKSRVNYKEYGYMTIRIVGKAWYEL